MIYTYTTHLFKDLNIEKPIINNELSDETWANFDNHIMHILMRKIQNFGNCSSFPFDIKQYHKFIYFVCESLGEKNFG